MAPGRMKINWFKNSWKMHRWWRPTSCFKAGKLSMPCRLYKRSLLQSRLHKPINLCADYANKPHVTLTNCIAKWKLWSTFILITVGYIYVHRLNKTRSKFLKHWESLILLTFVLRVSEHLWSEHWSRASSWRLSSSLLLLIAQTDMD